MKKIIALVILAIAGLIMTTNVNNTIETIGAFLLGAVIGGVVGVVFEILFTQKDNEIRKRILASVIPQGITGKKLKLNVAIV